MKTTPTTPPEPKPDKPTKVMQVQLLVTLEVSEGDFDAVSKAMAHIGLACENVSIDHKSTRTVKR